MHHCLEIWEILLAIFDYLSSTEPSNTDVPINADLTSIARTCRHFYDPAMDILWHTLGDLSPLFQCLPKSIWYKDVKCNPSFSTTILSLRRSLTSSEWSSVIKHAHRVKVFNCEVSYAHVARGHVRSHLQWRISQEALKEIITHCELGRGPDPMQPKILFPNLNGLYWVWDLMGKDWISSIPYFAGTSLKQLQIGINCPPETTDSPSIMYRVLEEMPHRHPLLESLELPHFYMGWLSVESVTSHLLQSFTRLKRVKLSTRLTEKTFPDLTHLRDLASLHVSLDIKALNPLAAHSPPTKLFPRLKNLEMTAQTLQTCITLLDYTKSLTINTLTATLTQPNVSVSEVQELCDRLQKQKELQTVHVSGPLRRIAVSNAKPVLPSTIYPLLLLPNITNVYLRLQLHVELDDGFIESIATSWPHLTKLHIVHMVPLPAKPRVTLAGLLPLSKFCLRLKELSLAVDICLPDAFDQRHAHMLRRQRSLCHPLTDMNIYWWIGDISGLERQDKDSWEVCAQFLVDLFPLVYRRFCWHTSLSTNPLGCRTFETLVIQNGICGQKGLENLARNDSR